MALSFETPAELEARILAATEALAVAERELEAAIAELRATETADRRMITARLQKAFTNVRGARSTLQSAIDRRL